VGVPVFDLVREARDGVAPFDTRATTFAIAGIDNTGSVYASGGPDGATSWRWDRGTGVTTALRGVDGRVVSVRNGRRIVVAQGSGAQTRTTIGTLDPSGTFRPESTLRGPLTIWSPDDKMVAHASRERSSVVQVRSGTGERVLGLPGDVDVRSLVWEDEDDLLLWVADTAHRVSLLRCRTSDAGCEIALGSFGPDAALPRRP
jgi:hypothetical protein